MPEEHAPGSSFGLLLLLLGGVNLTLGVLLNEVTLSFMYADGRLVRDVVARIRTVQAGFAVLGLLFGLAGGVLRAWSPRRLSQHVWNLALAVLLFAYVPILAELLLSLRYPGFYLAWDPFRLCRASLAIDDARLGHVLNPDLDHSYRISRQGFRGPDAPMPKPPEEMRLIAVGDSITFGWELSEDEATYPSQLQALMERREPGGRAIRVINAGVPRYTSEQVLRLLQERVLDLKPDVVVLCVGWNDLAFSYHRHWRPRISFTGHTRARYCRGFSPAIVRTIRHWKGGGGDEEEAAEDAQSRPPGRGRTPDPGALAAFRANLDEIASLLQQRGVGLLVLNLPSVLSRGPMSATERSLARRFPEVENLALFEEVLRDFCRGSRTSCTLDAFPLEQTGKGPYFYDHCHPNRDGNAILAGKVYEAIERDPRLLVSLGRSGTGRSQ